MWETTNSSGRFLQCAGRNHIIALQLKKKSGLLFKCAWYDFNSSYDFKKGNSFRLFKMQPNLKS